MRNYLESDQFKFWQGVATVIFRISFVTFLILMLVEYLEPGFVTNWFNPLWLLIIVIFSATIGITKEKH